MKKRMTASELMAQLNADPAFVASREAQEKLRQERITEFRTAAAPIVRDLRDAGIRVDAVSKVTRKTPGFKKALPILLKHLQQSSYPPAVREAIARTLAVPEARFGWSTLVEQYRSEREKAPKDGLAVALAAISDGDTIDQVTALFGDANNGSSRVLLVRALARSSNPKARAALLEFRKDPDVAKEIARVLHRESGRPPGARRSHAVSALKRSRSDALAETSMSFDWEDVRPFLESVAKLVQGFDAEDIGRVVGVLDGLEADDEATFAFEVRIAGRKLPLETWGFKCDIDAVDLSFRASPWLVENIKALFFEFSDPHGK
jgi:hypothetical protein